MSKKRRPPAKRDKAPNQKEQRRYQRELKRKRLRERPPQKRQRPKKFPLGFGTGLFIAVLWSLGIGIADSMQISFDGDTAILVMVPFVILPFIVMPLLVKVLGKKWSDPVRAYDVIDRLDVRLWILGLAVLVSVKLGTLIAKLFR